MAFFGTEFILDGVPSSTYNLYISNMDGGELDFVPASSSVELFKDRVYRRTREYFYGASQSPILEFTLVVTSPNPMDAKASSAAKKWMFGRLQRKQLQIVQEDFSDLHFYCTFLEPEEIKVGNLTHGFSFTVSCDSPFAWEFERTLTKPYGDYPTVSSFTFYNDSDDEDYLYPQMSITMNNLGGDLTITNASDDSRQFVFTGLDPSEVITIDNDRQILTSSSGLLRMDTFNKKWMRFVQGENDLTVDGNPLEIVFTYQFARKVGT